MSLDPSQASGFPYEAAAVLLALAGLLGWAAVDDLRRFTIPNSLTIAVVALWPVWLVLAAGGFTLASLAGAALAALAVLVLGLVAFRFGLMGGGDVKLLAALALWAGPVGTLPLLAHVALAGGVLSLFWMSPLRPRLAPVLGRTVAEADGARLPYGVAIAAGGLAMVARLPFA